MTAKDQRALFRWSTCTSWRADIAQAPFRYQGKCHDALRKELAALPGEVRRCLDPVLKQAGYLA
jgi:hypothetical protein